MTRPTLKLGTRASQLALWQANFVKARLEARWGDALAVEIVKISTRGDTDQETPLALLGGKGVFVRAIERALLDGEIDLAVHSMKDLPSRLPEGLAIAAVPERADPRDVLVGTPAGATFSQLPAGTRLGTGSLRRAALVRRANPDLRVVPIRGNVPTRVAKIDEGQVDGVLLAAAGLVRLGLGDRIATWLPPERFLPAACQGLLALQIREDDAVARERVGALADASATVMAEAERGFLAELGAGCNVPLGAHARLTGPGEVTVDGLIIHPEGRPCFQATRVGSSSTADEVGRSLARTLLDLGAGQVLEVGLAGSPGG